MNNSAHGQLPNLFVKIQLGQSPVGRQARIHIFNFRSFLSTGGPNLKGNGCTRISTGEVNSGSKA